LIEKNFTEFSDFVCVVYFLCYFQTVVATMAFVEETYNAKSKSKNKYISSEKTCSKNQDENR